MGGLIINLDNIQEILQGCRQGDRQSQEKLYKQLYPGLFSLCKKFFDDKHDILSALNNGMLNVYKNINVYDDTKGNLFNWAYGVVRHAVLTYLRNKKIIVVHLELTDKTEWEDTTNPFNELEWKDIYFYLGKLPPATRVICTLYYMEGFAIKEIAEQLSLSDGTVKWHLSESRTKLKNIITKTIIAKSA